MKIISLSQSCTSVINAQKNYGSVNKKTGQNANIAVNNNSNSTEIKTFNNSLQKMYCLYSLGFLACMTAFYLITAYICSQAKGSGSQFLKIA